MKKKLLSLLLAAALSSGVVVATASPAAAQDNAAVAVNTKDGTSIFRFAFSIHRLMRDVVDQTNAAVAVSSCTECQTIAIAIQVVLIMSDPSIVTPTNLALALNVGCDSCETLASAYQFVLTTGLVRFTSDGLQQIAEIKQEIRELLRDEDATIEEIQAELDVLMDELRQILAAELVAIGPSGEDDDADEPDVEDTASPDATDSPTVTPTTSPSPSTSETPSASATPTATSTD